MSVGFWVPSNWGPGWVTAAFRSPMLPKCGRLTANQAPQEFAPRTGCAGRRCRALFELPPGGKRPARFMSGVFPVRQEWRQRLAAITHVDGTARVQVLEAGMAPRLYALLRAYERRSGIPILLNTSFNLAGEPIVNRCVEGYLTFRRSGIDVLAAGRTRVTKRILEKPT